MASPDICFSSCSGPPTFFSCARAGFRHPNIFPVGGDQCSTRGDRDDRDDRGGVRRGVDERVLRAVLSRDRVRGTVGVLQSAWSTALCCRGTSRLGVVAVERFNVGRVCSLRVLCAQTQRKTPPPHPSSFRILCRLSSFSCCLPWFPRYSDVRFFCALVWDARAHIRARLCCVSCLELCLVNCTVVPHTRYHSGRK